MTRVLIVDDDRLTRDMIRNILDSQGIDVVGDVSDGDQVPDAVARHRPDIVLIDLQMHRMSGVDAIRHHAARPGAPRYVALTGFGTEDAVADALDAGAAGFLSKDDDPAFLANHLRAVARGGAALGHDAAAVVIRRLNDGALARRKASTAQARLAELTDREQAVAALVAGRTNQQIARRLGMSENTVKAHLARARDKLNLADRAELAALVQRAAAGA